MKALFLMLFFSISTVIAQRVTQQVTVEVLPLSGIHAETPGTLMPNTTTKVLCNYLTNLDNARIGIAIDEKMPKGTQLLVELTSTKAMSLGRGDASDALTQVILVAGISRMRDVGQTLSYTFITNGKVQPFTRTVTLILEAQKIALQTQTLHFSN